MPLRLPSGRTKRRVKISNRDLTREECQSLEAFVDSTNLNAVLQALSTICGEKAEHVQTNWQDRTLAKQWSSAEGVIGVCAVNRHILEVSH